MIHRLSFTRWVEVEGERGASFDLISQLIRGELVPL